VTIFILFVPFSLSGFSNRLPMTLRSVSLSVYQSGQSCLFLSAGLSVSSIHPFFLFAWFCKWEKISFPKLIKEILVFNIFSRKFHVFIQLGEWLSPTWFAVKSTHHQRTESEPVHVGSERINVKDIKAIFSSLSPQKKPNNYNKQTTTPKRCPQNKNHL